MHKSPKIDEMKFSTVGAERNVPLVLQWDPTVLQWDPTASFGSIDPLNDTPPRSRFAGKSGGKTFLIRWVESGQSSRVLWCHSLALLAALGHEFCADAVHHLFEAARLIIADGGTLADVHVDTATGL